jgi:hypothetical protein
MIKSGLAILAVLWGATLTRAQPPEKLPPPASVPEKTDVPEVKAPEPLVHGPTECARCASACGRCHRTGRLWQFLTYRPLQKGADCAPGYCYALRVTHPYLFFPPCHEECGYSCTGCNTGHRMFAQPTGLGCGGCK